MLEKYKYLNTNAKTYLHKEFNKVFLKKCNNDDLYKRCMKELDLLYDKGLLFIIEILYKYKKKNSKNTQVSYYLRGTINNLQVLYILGITNVDSIKYDLPYELFNDNSICVDLANDHPFSLFWFIEKELQSELKIVYGYHEKEEDKELDELEDNHYLLLPYYNDIESKLDITFRINEYFMYETVEDYRKYKNELLNIRIDEKEPITSYKVTGIENVLTNDFEKKLASTLNPTTIKDYIKIKSIGHGTNVWSNNQDILFNEGKININNLIATREDILEYLLEHSIDKDKSIEILNFIRKGRQKTEPKKWEEYVEIMKKHNCEDVFIDIFSKILFIFGRGQAVSECLFVLDESNYIENV